MIRSLVCVIVALAATTSQAAQVNFIGTIDSRTVIAGVPGAGPLDPLPPSRSVNISLVVPNAVGTSTATGLATVSGIAPFNIAGSSSVTADGTNLSFVLDLGSGFFGSIVFNGVAGTNIDQALFSTIENKLANSFTLTHLQAGGAIQYAGSITAVPEPSSMMVLGGLVMGGIVRYRRRRS